MARRVTGLTRRQIISGTAIIGSTLALDGAGRVDARTVAGEIPFTPGEANAPTPAEPGGYQFFTSDEAAFIDAAVARLIPNDELGPGAKEAGVTVFIDRQLAGPFGKAETWYMQGPWDKGEATQGYQTRLTPAQLYRAAIKAIDAHVRDSDKKSFAELPPDRQDAVISSMEKGDLKLDGVDATGFFDVFSQNTIEGFFSDPIYGGNRDMAGWKLIGFPGARYDYRPYVKRHGEKLALQPVGLKGRPDWNRKS